MANVIDAIINLIENPIISLKQMYLGSNRVNNVGDALETYVQDLFIGQYDLPDDLRLQQLSEIFSYKGNTSNPPDLMLKGGDAIEVKKIESRNSDLAFNSSYPKAKLLIDNPMITTACKMAENWQKKDMLYAVGIMNGENLQSLAFVYGDDYFSNDGYYNQIQDLILSDKQHIATAELKVNWRAKSPFKVFDYIYESNANANFDFMAIINDEKWYQLNNASVLKTTIKNNSNAQLQKVEIKNPNSEHGYKGAYLITFFVE